MDEKTISSMPVEADVSNGSIRDAALSPETARLESKYGHVERRCVHTCPTIDQSLTSATRLRSRHMQFIALGGAIGTSLFLGIGSSLAKAGPLSLLLGFSVAGATVYAMVNSEYFLR